VVWVATEPHNAGLMFGRCSSAWHTLLLALSWQAMPRAIISDVKDALLVPC
jgi:hypothetical protein